jgi:hydroxymethylpyrimidine pyrophosphatase-like HAD family hydrolase
MAKPYDLEMARLADTFAWAEHYDVDRLIKAVAAASTRPLVAIGSGGSLTAAVALAGLHQATCRQLGTVFTPLEAANAKIESDCTYWLLSAGGSNVDINRAAKSLIEREPRQITVLCGREDSPLAELCRAHPFVDLIVCPPPAGKDGFLATNSLLGFIALMMRSYLHKEEKVWALAAKAVRPALPVNSKIAAGWRKATAPLWDRSTLLVLHGLSTRAGATDIESKFVEAALGNVQLADYRNFAHGRHHWLAKRASESAVLALVGEDDLPLADRTLALLPKSIPTARLDFGGNAQAAQLLSLVAALRMTEWIGQARGIDPGRPGVPSFGRKLYHLPLPRPKASEPLVKLSPRLAMAITRKSGRDVARMSHDELQQWADAVKAFHKRLSIATFQAAVFDYDGTLVDTRDRFKPVSDEIAEALIVLLDKNVTVGIATGRGKSVRVALQNCLPKKHWSKVLVGYYNGAELAPLDHDNCPDGQDGCAEILRHLAENLTADPELAVAAKQTNRQLQITLEPNLKCAVPEGRLWDLAQQVLLRGNYPGVTVTRSSHSVDILAPGVSKIAVLDRLREQLGKDAAILTVGDRGKWPGNDYTLLATPYALSVDEASIDLATGWNLGAPGQRGIAVTREYLTGLAFSAKGFKFAKGALP